ncbi:MAG: MFS transporter [Myxococcales bacterium]|nr:MFS transporter [Myxococcales bacterium]
MSAVSIWREPTATQYRTFFAAWSGWVLDAFDFTIFLLVMPHIEAEFGVKNVATTASIALTLLARLVGGYVAGKAADRWGRRLPLLLSIVWFALCDGAVALAPSFTAVLVLRTLFGFGMGAEWTSGTTLAMENWPARSRGIASGVLQGSWAIGYLLAAAVSAFVVPRFGWRGLFVVAALPALLVLPMRFAIPESDEWKSARGKTERLATLREVFRKYPTLLGRTLWASFAMAAGFGAYYAITGLYPSMLVAEHGMDAAAVAKLVAIFNVGMMVGAVGCGYLASRSGTTWGLAAPAAISLLVLPLYVGMGSTSLALGALLAGAFGVGFSGVTPMLLTGLFPAEARARLVGIVYHVGALFAGFMPMLVAALAKQMPLSRAIWITATALEVLLVLLVVFRKRDESSATTPAEVEVMS